MATATKNDKQDYVEHASVFGDPESLYEVCGGKPVGNKCRKTSARNSTAAHSDRVFLWRNRLTRILSAALVLFGAALIYLGTTRPVATNSALVSPTTSSSPTSKTLGEKQLTAKPIQDIRVGERLVGRNPIREQAELVEPDPASWRKISLHMTKGSGLGLWIELLRPLTWIEEHGVEPGNTVFIDLHEMGAAGDAQVIDLGPCPEIARGNGTVVTGTFQHQADANTKVIQLGLEDQIELTTVTDNHPYWSVDRQDFVEAGKLQTGERVDTEYGLKRVSSVTPIEHKGFLYNLETTEHVYRVGSIGALVHNSCIPFDELAMWRGKIGSRSRDYTLAKLEIGGQEFFGKSFGKHLDEVYPFTNVNNISKFHAEGDVIGQALRQGVSASEAKIFIDRALCRSCGELHGLRNMAAELGIKRLFVYEKLGSGVSVFRINF
jgi:hypothetical protein